MFTPSASHATRLFAGIAAVSLTAWLGLGGARAEGESASTGGPRLETSGGPYCGVYSVYAALRLHGIEVEFKELLEPEYVGSFYGSTLGELRQAVTDFEAHAEAMEGLTASALRASPHPIILHVRRPGLNTPYAHWVLFLGTESGKARIVDPPNSVQLLPFAELLSLWDGTGLVIAKGPVQTWPIQTTAYFEQSIFLLLVIAVLGTVRLVSGRFGPRGHRYWPLPALVVVALGLAVVGHRVHDDGFLHNNSAVAQVVGRHFEPTLPSISVAEIEGILDRPGVTFLDARSPRAYKFGHLPGAINLPVYSGLVERAETLKSVNPTDHIVVYCQSENCSWGEVIASDLALRGYKNVYLFPGGWNEWEQHEQSKPGQ